MSFQARYRSQCVSCGNPINEGEHVMYEDGHLVHLDCPDPIDDDQPARNERRCPDCFTIHAGDCL